MHKTEYFFGELVSYSCISVVGLGYIGLPTAAVLASQKNKVVGIDVNQDTVDIINSGKVHIVEPGLDTIVNSVTKAGFLKATTFPVPSDVFLIAVPTPFKKILLQTKFLSQIFLILRQHSRQLAQL